MILPKKSHCGALNFYTHFSLAFSVCWHIIIRSPSTMYNIFNHTFLPRFAFDKLVSSIINSLLNINRWVKWNASNPDGYILRDTQKWWCYWYLHRSLEYWKKKTGLSLQTHYKHVFRFSYFYVFMFSGFHVSMFSCFHVLMFSCLHVFMFSCFHVFMLQGANSQFELFYSLNIESTDTTSRVRPRISQKYLLFWLYDNVESFFHHLGYFTIYLLLTRKKIKYK